MAYKQIWEDPLPVMSGCARMHLLSSVCAYASEACHAESNKEPWLTRRPSPGSVITLSDIVSPFVVVFFVARCATNALLDCVCFVEKSKARDVLRHVWSGESS